MTLRILRGTPREKKGRINKEREMGVGEEDSAGWERRNNLCAAAAGFHTIETMEGRPWKFLQDAVRSLQDALSC